MIMEPLPSLGEGESMAIKTAFLVDDDAWDFLVKCIAKLVDAGKVKKDTKEIMLSSSKLLQSARAILRSFQTVALHNVRYAVGTYLLFNNEKSLYSELGLSAGDDLHRVMTRQDTFKKELGDLLAEGDKPLRCKCGNGMHFSVFISRMMMVLDDDGKIKSIEEEGDIASPSTIIFVCDECNSIALESSIY